MDKISRKFLERFYDNSVEWLHAPLSETQQSQWRQKIWQIFFRQFGRQVLFLPFEWIRPATAHSVHLNFFEAGTPARKTGMCGGIESATGSIIRFHFKPVAIFDGWTSRRWVPCEWGETLEFAAGFYDFSVHNFVVHGKRVGAKPGTDEFTIFADAHLPEVFCPHHDLLPLSTLGTTRHWS